MHAFTQHYFEHNAAADPKRLPVWDLCSALKPATAMGAWGLEPAREAHMRAALAGFVDDAIARLPENATTRAEARAVPGIRRGEAPKTAVNDAD